MPPRRRKKTVPAPPGKKGATPGRSAAPPKFFPSPGSFLRYWTLGLLALELLLALASWNHTNFRFLFLILAFCTALSFWRRPRHPLDTLGLVGVGWLLFVGAVGTYGYFNYAFPTLPRLLTAHPILPFSIGLGLLAAFWRFLPSGDGPVPEPPHFLARAGFWVIFLAAAFLRLYKAHDPVGNYWDDSAICIADPRGVLEFHDRHMFFPIGTREPFFTYYLAGLWALMPDAYAIFVQRLGSGLGDLLGVWLFYLLGKEVGGRWVGLVACALAAFSKPMLISDLLGFQQVMVPMVVALILFTTFRLFKKPDWPRFLQWGLALGFMPYNYTAQRPWALFIVVAVFGWILAVRRENRARNWGLALGCATFVTWVFLFLRCNNFLPFDNPLVTALNQVWVGLVVLVLLWVLFALSILKRKPREESSPFPKFFAALFLAGTMLYPLVSNPDFYHHMSGLSIFHDRDARAFRPTGESVSLMAQKVGTTLQTVFEHGEDRNDSNIPDHPFLGFHAIPILLLGFVALLARPSWLKLFLLVCTFVGLSPHILSVDPHTGKLLACLPPMALLGGLGVLEVIRGAQAAFPRNRFAIGGLAVLFASYFAWAVMGSFNQVYDVYFQREYPDVTVTKQLRQYWPQDRVYLALFSGFGHASTMTQAILDQGMDVRTVGAQNPIYLKPGEPRKDLMVLIAWLDEKTKALINRQYKNVSWEMIDRGVPEAQQHVALRALIPAAEIPDKPGKLFYIQEVPEGNWTRDYLMDRIILGYGLIQYEDSVADPYAPVNTSMDCAMVNLYGSFNLPHAARVTFKVKSANIVKFMVDGKSILYIKPFENTLSDSKTVELAAGKHQVTYYTAFAQKVISPILMSVDGGPEMRLGETGTGAPQPNRP